MDEKNRLKINGCIKTKFGCCSYNIDPIEGACIYSLYICEEYRREGHAKELLHMIINVIRATGYAYEIGIEADPKGDSISKDDLALFYKKTGLYVTNFPD
jgi:GNAT superfamily N-acetyltransferase